MTARPRWRPGLQHAIAAALFALMTTPAPAQQPGQQPGQPPERDRERGQPAQQPPEGEAPRAREGGIPREMIQEDPERSRDGADEGVPQLRQRDGRGDSRIRPQFLPPRSDWKLGVYAYNTETGVVVTRVVRGSPAERIGMERGDRIVTVGGFQVGYVGNFLYPLGHELQRQAGPRGRVLLLLENVRNSELLVRQVELERARDRDRFPPRLSPPRLRERERSDGR